MAQEAGYHWAEGLTCSLLSSARFCIACPGKILISTGYGFYQNKVAGDSRGYRNVASAVVYHAKRNGTCPGIFKLFIVMYREGLPVLFS